MKRVVSLFLPNWPTDRLRRRMGASAPSPEVPLVLVGRDGRRQVIAAADAAARRLGVTPGLAAAKARALSGELVLKPADPEADRADLERLAAWALRLYSPLTAADPPDGLILDVTGAAHLRGGEAALLEDLVGRLARSGVEARAAAAGSAGAAHALARHGAETVRVCPPGRDAEALAPLPALALRIPAGLALDLERVGLETIGDLLGRPRAPLARRFGPELVQRLDQALGRTAEPLTPQEVPEIPSVRRAFAEPLSAPETLARQVLKLTEDLCLRLETRGLGARRLDLRLHRIDGRVEAARARLARPARDAPRLARLLAEQLETVDPGFGIEAMVLAAPGAEPLAPRPAAALGAPPETDPTALIDTLSGRLGQGRVYRLRPAESEVPERSAVRIAPEAPPCGTSWPVEWPRPPRLLSPPEPIEVVALLPDQPPAAFSWRGVRRRVLRADGPERIFGEWWLRDCELYAVRDYFQLEDEAGERFWVFRRGDGEAPATGDLAWFLHGLFA